MTEKMGQKTEMPPLHRTVVLVGIMGAGKTAIGRRLAKQIDFPFVDADVEIEKAAGCTITEIFERHGEQAFRDGERRVISRLLDAPPQILATGGGAFMDTEIRHLIHEKAVSIWLKADLEVVLERVSRRGGRPLLTQGNPRETLERLLVEREPVYAEADITIQSRDKPLAVTVDVVTAALADFLTEHPQSAKIPVN